MENLYEVLGVPETSSQDEIKKGYRQQAMKWHPDRNPGNKEEAEERFKQIGYAYKVLSDPAQRAEYDSELARMRSAGAQDQANNNQQQTSRGASQSNRGRGFTEEDASTLFFEQMLDLAIELASRGYAEKLIVKALIGLDCPEAVAVSVARIAVDRFQAKASNTGNAWRASDSDKNSEAPEFHSRTNSQPGGRASSTFSGEQGDKPSQWLTLEPYFRAALVGPDFDVSDLNKVPLLRFVRAAIFFAAAFLMSFLLLKTQTENVDFGTKFGLVIIGSLLGWGMAYSLLRFSPAQRLLELKDREAYFLPLFEANFIEKRKFQWPSWVVLFPATWFGFYGVIWPLAITVIAISLLYTGQLLVVSEASFTNEVQLNLWRLTNYPQALSGLWIGVGATLPYFLYKKVHAVVIRTVNQQPANLHAAMTMIHMECRPKAWRAVFVTLVAIFSLAAPEMIFESEASWLNEAVKAEKLTADALFEEAQKTVQSASPTPSSAARVYVYLVIAANKGNVKAESLLGNLYGSDKGWFAQDKNRMLYWLTRAADHGSLWAMAYLGHHYYHGTNGLPKDELKAVNYWRQAASHGYPSALVSMGWAHMTGIGGVPIDFGQAFVLNSKGAEGGDREGYNNLGWQYENGKGVAQNLRLAIENYRKAAELGSVEAKERYEKLAQHLNSQQSEATPEQRRVELVIAELERMFPSLNPDSPQYNQRFADRVISRQKELIAQGYSPSVALRNAGYEVARQLRLM